MFGLTPVRHNGMQKGNAYGDFYNAIDNFFNDDFFGRSVAGSSAFRMDVKEDDKKYLIEAELPGFTKEEITLDYNKDTLYIAAEHKQMSQEAKENEEGKEAEANQEETNQEEVKQVGAKQEKYLHRERRNISMQRGIYLENINIEAIEAKLENGILTVSVSKLEKPQTSFKITIQ